MFFVRQLDPSLHEPNLAPIFVRRKVGKEMPTLSYLVDWKQTFFLNLIVQTTCTLTVSVCKRTPLHSNNINNNTGAANLTGNNFNSDTTTKSARVNESSRRPQRLKTSASPSSSAASPSTSSSSIPASPNSSSPNSLSTSPSQTVTKKRTLRKEERVVIVAPSFNENEMGTEMDVRNSFGRNYDDPDDEDKQESYDKMKNNNSNSLNNGGNETDLDEETQSHIPSKSPKKDHVLSHISHSPLSTPLSSSPPLTSKNNTRMSGNDDHVQSSNTSALSPNTSNTTERPSSASSTTSSTPTPSKSRMVALRRITKKVYAAPYKFVYFYITIFGF